VEYSGISVAIFQLYSSQSESARLYSEGRNEVIALTENIGKYRKYTLVMYVQVRRMNTVPIGMDGTFDLTVIY
jgi:hypothetical protein